MSASSGVEASENPGVIASEKLVCYHSVEPVNTCPTGHQSQAIKGSVLWLVATKGRVPAIVFLGDTNKLGRLGGECKDGARHALPPISRENYSWHLGMCLIRSLPSGQSYEDKLIGHFRRKTRVAFSVCCFYIVSCGVGAS